MGKNQLTLFEDEIFEARFGGGPVAGIDEVGRGPLAGPVIAAAVILDPLLPISGLNDSKKLSALRREALYPEIMKRAITGIGSASVAEIDKTNILRATFLAMRRAVAALAQKPVGLLVDGNQDPKLGFPTEMVIKGDARCQSIAAASIIAKVTRDHLMTQLAVDFPHYGWEKNAGYGVPHHLKALELVGISPHHRRSFAPVTRLLLQDS